jgi:hypothetical protein
VEKRGPGSGQEGGADKIEIGYRDLNGICRWMGREVSKRFAGWFKESSGDRGHMHVGLDLGFMGGRLRLRLLIMIKGELFWANLWESYVGKERKTKSRLDYGVCI